MAITTPTSVSDIPSISHREWGELGRAQNAALLALLAGLDEEEWRAPTDCEGWDVKDIATHVLAWAEAITSPTIYTKQWIAGIREKKSFGGNALDATNDFQIKLRRDLSTAELQERLGIHLRRQATFLARAGIPLKVVPYKEPFAGHWVNLGYVANVIFTRDHYMHRLDISRAVGRDPEPAEGDARLVADIVKEWTKRSKASVVLELSGPAGGAFRCGSGASGSIRGDAYDFTRRLAGRKGDLELEGDTTAIEGWLGVLCTF